MKLANPEATDTRVLRDLLSGSWRQTPPAPILTQAELDEIAPKMIRRALGPLAWWKIRSSPLSATPTGEALRNIYRRQALIGAIHMRDAAGVIARFQAAGVDPILVKGWSVAWAYPHPSMRPMGDIDLVVRTEEFARAEKVMKAAAGELDGKVDLHAGFAKLDNRSQDDLYSRSQQLRLSDNVQVRVLGPEDHLRVLCIHALRHVVYHPKWLCDIAAAFENRAPDFDWDLFIGKDQRTDWLDCAIGLAHYLLGMEVADTPFTTSTAKLPPWLVNRVLEIWRDGRSPLIKLAQENPYLRSKDPTKVGRLRPASTFVRDPRGLLEFMKSRWPDPVEATILSNGVFSRPPLYNQTHYFLLRTFRAARTLPADILED